MQLTIAGAKVRIDNEGRYSLNDLHKASGGNPNAQPAFFMRRKETDSLIASIANSANLQSIAENETTVNPVFKKEGRGGGTFVCKELVYEYAMWLDSDFKLKVIHAFDALANGRLKDAERIASRNTARLEAPYLTDAIKHRREVQGKEVAHYHFSNEFDLINRVALGQSAKQYREAHGLNKDDPIRDHLTPMEIRCIEHLQRANATMIDLGFDFEKRKVDLHRLYVTRHAAGLMAEVERISV